MAKQQQQEERISSEELYRPISSASGDHRETVVQVNEKTGEEEKVEVRTPWVIKPSQIFRGSHDLVQKYPHLFERAHDVDRPNAEQTTARQGEQR